MNRPMEVTLKELNGIENEMLQLRNRKARLQSDVKQEIIALKKFELLNVNWPALRQSIRKGKWSITV